MAAIAGLRGTGDWAVDQRPKDFGETILMLNPNGNAPLTGFTSKMARSRAHDPEYSHWEEKLQTVRVQINNATGYTAGATTLVIDSTTGLDATDIAPGDVLLHEPALESSTFTEEIMTVASVTNATTIVVNRGQAGSTAVALADNDSLTKVGNAFGEGTLGAVALGRNPTKVVNYTQIFKTAMSWTRTAGQTDTRTGSTEKTEMRRKTFEHSAAIEWAFLFGKKFEGVGANQKPIRYTGGLRSHITTNATVFTVTPTLTTFQDAINPVFDYTSTAGGNERLLFAGNGFMNSLNRLVEASPGTQIRYSDTIQVYGMNLTKLILPSGTLFFRTHPLLNTHSRYTNSAFVIDPSALTYKFLEETKLMRNIQPNDADYVKHQWISEIGLQVRHEETMAYLGNFVV